MMNGKMIWACGTCHKNCLALSEGQPGDDRCPRGMHCTSWYHWDRRKDDRDDYERTSDGQTLIDDLWEDRNVPMES